jgi:hypothetical protein
MLYSSSLRAESVQTSSHACTQSTDTHAIAHTHELYSSCSVHIQFYVLTHSSILISPIAVHTISNCIG